VFFLLQSVFKSDLLHLNLALPLTSDAEVDSYFEHLQQIAASEERTSLDSFIAESCHAVVFSLLLEYLPTSRQRVECCRTAWRLLVVDGLLLIVTPDSRQQHRNHRFTCDWRRAIESIGFARCRYEKLQHLHCMAFRRLVTDNCQPGWPESTDTALCISHDKDGCLDAVVACDTQIHTKQSEATADDNVCYVCAESNIDVHSELLDTVSG